MIFGEFESELEAAGEAMVGPLRGQAGRFPARRMASQLRKQGFLVRRHFLDRLRQRAQDQGIRFDPRAFGREFRNAPHFRQTRPGYNTLIALMRGLPVLYRMGGPRGMNAVLVGLLPQGALPPSEPIKAPYLRETDLESELQWAASEMPGAPCPPDQPDLVRGFGRYSNSIVSLPLNQRKKIADIAALIVNSFGPGFEPIQGVRMVGHADQDPGRGPEFERHISGRRAQEVLNALVRRINNPAISSRIGWQAVPAGSTQLAVQTPRNESERQCNRRVQIFPTTRRQEQELNQKVEEILVNIRQRAMRAVDRLRTVAGSNFVRVLEARYLSDYLGNPNPATASAALERIGLQNTSGKVSTVCGVPDIWERATPIFNGRSFPAVLRQIPGLQWLPENFGAATEILTVKNRRALSYLDLPFLLGDHTINWFDCSSRVQRNFDPDLQFDNSKNESQLMHWATGVRFSALNRERLRELFLAYELWHLEYWDVFGPDPLNDLLAEEAGRHMAVSIRGLRVNRQNFINVLDEGFRNARAWVGALLRLRRDQLDRQIRMDPPPSAWFHWIAEVPSTSPHHPFPAPAIRQMLLSGISPDRIMDSKLVARYVEVYTLLFEADRWERANGVVPLSFLQRQMAIGSLNPVFQRLAMAESSSRLSQFSFGRRQFESGWPALYGCTPCIAGWKICHKNIVPDDGSCRYIGWDNWYCRC